MGNVVQCCPTFLNYFKCSSALVRGELERSALLSSEGSECDLPSLPEAAGEDLLPGSSNLTLEPENFLFPDIILSSNLGGDVNPVEPMVCLLVSEDEDGTRVNELGKEARGRSSGGCYGAETQTEVEIRFDTGVQTQTKFRGQSEVLMHHNPNVEAGVNMLVRTENANENICEGLETIKEVERPQQRKLSVRVTGFTEKNKDFVQPHNSNLLSLALETGEGDSNTENFNFAGCVDGKQTKSRNASERQTPDQIKGSENVHWPVTGWFQREEDAAGMRSVALFSLDRLFLTGQHHKTPLGDTDLHHSVDQSIKDISDPQNSISRVRIQPPAEESFELQVSGQMLVGELQQVLMEHEVTCHRTCFSLRLGGVPLDGHTKLCSIQDGAVIKVEEELYSVRDAHLHLRHVRDLLRSLDLADAYNGVNGSSLSYLGFFIQRDKDIVNEGGRRASENGSVDFRPPEYVLPGSKNRPLTPLQPLREDRKPIRCLKALSMSSWNPPPGNRKMHGDLMYLNILTIEDKELNVTSSTRGFYLNQSTAFNFNAKPAAPKLLCHSLVELLSQVSPAFKKTFSDLQNMRALQHLYERTATPFQVFTWIAPERDYTLDCARAEEMNVSPVGQEEYPAGQSRDWNEELQVCKELSRHSFQERLHREMKIFKTNSDFVGAATRGAVAVIDGNIMPLNPAEPPHMQMFLWNNLFFSLGFDTSDHYEPLGGNSAAHAAALCDLRGAQVDGIDFLAVICAIPSDAVSKPKAYADVDVEGLYTLGTAVVDYRGIRVIAQTIVPGILEKRQEQTVVYGSSDYGKTVFTHPRFLELLEKTCKPLRIERHKVLDHNNMQVELCSGIETKGVLGNDSRPYVLDFLRTFPPDLNFQLPDIKIARDIPEDCSKYGYPRHHPHSLASLRPELMEAFIQHRFELYVKMVSQGLERLEEQHEEKSKVQRTGDAAADAADMGFHRRNVIRDACKAVGSLSESCFDIRFNPDVCSTGVRFPSECIAQIDKRRLLLWDAAAFLLSHQIPAVLKDFLDLTAIPMDGLTLTEALHRRGVNMRYLGTLLMELERVEEKGRLSHVQRISLSEIIIRSAKRTFRTFLQGVDPAALSAAVSHFLNCFLSSCPCFLDSCSDELASRRRSRRRRSYRGRGAPLKDSVWSKLTPTELWRRIRREARDYFHYTINSESIDEVIERHGLQRTSLLREISMKTGIQVQLREYVFDSRHRPTFGEEDVINMFPVVKHLTITGTEATGLVQRARGLIHQGLLKDGYELTSQALALFVRVCGILHEDACMCLRLLGRLSYLMGEYSDALTHQEKAVMSSERLQGIDHPQTIQDYTHLALYCFAGGRHSTALQLLYRARHLTLIVSGEDHPQIIAVDSVLGLVLHGLMEHQLSLTFLKSAFILTSKYHGPTSLQYAHCHNLLATVYKSQGDLQSALQHEKEAYSIYHNQAAKESKTTEESSEYLKSPMQPAVSLQKGTEHVSTTGQTSVAKLSSSSHQTILQQLNVALGIVQ